MPVFRSPVIQGNFLSPVTQVSTQLHTDELFKTFTVKIGITVQCFSPGQHMGNARVKEMIFSRMDSSLYGTLESRRK